MAKKNIHQAVGATFNGSNEYINIGNNAYNYQHYSLDGVSGIGICAWCWIKTSDAGDNWIIGNWNTAGGDNGWGISTEATTGFLVGQIVHDETGGELLRVESDVAVNDGEWHLAAMSYDGSDGLSLAANLTLYVDGIPVPSTVVTDNLQRVPATETLTSTAMPSDGDTVTIGTPSVGSGLVKVYTFQTVLTDVDGNVDIGGSQAQAMENLRRAINLDGVAGTNYATSMTIHPDVEASDTATTVIATAKLPTTLPSVGNEVTTTEVSGVMSWGDTELSGADNRSTSTGTILLYQGRKGVASSPDFFLGRMANSGVLYRSVTQAEMLELWNGGTPVDPRLVSFADDLRTFGGWFSGGVGGDAWRPGTGLLGTSSTWGSTFGKDSGTDVSMEAGNYNKECPYQGYLNVLSTVFDGSDDHVDFGDVHDFERTDSFSIEFWFKTSTGAIQHLISKVDTASSDQGYEVAADASGSITFALSSDDPAGAGGKLEVSTTATGFDDGAWHHCVVTYAGDSLVSGTRIYIDTVDEPLTTVTDTLADSIVHAAALRFGADSASARRFTGNMCQAAFYGRVLIQAEVDELQGGGVGPVDKAGSTVWPALIGWWQLGSGDTSATITDRASSIVGDNDGTTAGTPALSDDVPQAFPYSPLTKSTLFDGVNDRIDFGNFALVDFDTTDPFSVGIWFRTTGDGFATLIGKSTPDSGTTGWGLLLDNGERLEFKAREATDPMGIETDSAVNDGDWHFVLATYDGSQTSAGMELYLDGVLQTAVTRSGDNNSALLNSGPLLVGEDGSSGFPNDPFPGNLCHASVWDIELNAGQASEVYGNGQPQALLDLSTSASLQWWSALGDGDALGTDGVLDLSGNANHGTATNMTADDFVLDPPPLGPPEPNALNVVCRFDEVENQYVDCGNVATFAFDNTDAFSLECVFRTSDTGTQYILSKSESAGDNRGYYIAIFSSGTINFVRRNIGGSNEVDIRTGAHYASGDWMHLIATCDGTNGASGMNIYINGKLASTVIELDTLSATILNAIPFQIGARNGTTTTVFNGDIADVAVYNKELSAAEIAEHTNAGFVGELGRPVLRHKLSTAVDLVAWYPMTVGFSNEATIFDMASNSFNHGTLTGDEVGIGMLESNGPEPLRAGFSGSLTPGITQIGPQHGRTQRSLPGTPPRTQLNDGLIGPDSQLRPRNPAEENQGSPTPPGGGGVGITTFFQMRGVDNGTSAFTTWTVLEDPDPNGAQANGGNTTPTLVGSIVAGSGIVISSWQQ